MIPTLNPGRHAHALTVALRRQTLQPCEWIVLDSESDDGSMATFVGAGARVERVERATFNHGRVRNRGAALASGDVVVFLTQDAEPADERCLECLVAPLTDGVADAAFARHLPRPEASPLERFARGRNYPPEPRLVCRADVPSLGVMAYFFSDACSAVRREALINVGGFPEYTVTNEDLLFSARLLERGGAIAYVPSAQVFHSHRLGPVRTFRRYFDIGAFFTQAGAELTVDGLTGSGATYARSLFGSLVRHRQFGWLVPALTETLAKWMGHRLGRMHHHLPLALVRRLSGHPGFWREHPGQ